MAEFSLGEAVLGTAIDLTGLDEGIKEGEEHARSGFAAIGDVIGGALKVGLAVAAAGIAAAGAFVASGVADAREAAQIMAQTEAVIKSTGSAAGMTAQQVADLASRLSATSGKSLFGDDLIQQSENILLTFTEIGKDVFPLATQASLDMAQALHSTPEAMSMMLGKALNSADGFVALKRSGVAFTDSQEQQIKTLFASGRAADAQRIILAELNKEFGGSAEAAAKADGGLAQFKDRMGEAAEGIGTALLPLLNDLGGFLNDTIAPAVEATAGRVADLIAAFQTGAEGGDFLGGLINALYSLDDISPVFDTIGDGVTVLAGLFDDLSGEGGGLGVLADDLSALTGVDLGPVLDVFQGLVDTFIAAEDPITGFLDVLSEVSPTFELLRGVVEAALPPIQSIVESVFGIISGLIEEHGAKMLADVTAVWQGIQDIIDGLLPPIQSIIESVFGGIADFLAAHSDEIEATLGKAWDTLALVVQAAIALISATIVPAFEYIAQFLAAHSEEIQQILGGAWKIISGVIDAALTLIQGIIKSALQLIQGDFSGAWQTIQDMNEQVWADIQQVLSGAWDIIKGLIAAGVDFVIGQFTGMPAQVAGVGQAIVDAIWNGLKARWAELEAWFNAQLQSLRDQLPFSEPKDSSSPLYGLSEAGRSIIEQINIGMRGAAGLLPATMRDVGGQATTVLQSAIDDLASVFGDSDAPDAAEGLGSDILTSMATGIADNIGQAVFAATQAAEDVISALEDAFDMHSPSQVMMDIGSNILLGIIMGVQDLTPDLYDAVSAAAAVIVEAMDLPANQVAERTQQVVQQLIGQITSLQEAAERALEDAAQGQIDLGHSEERALGAVDRFQDDIKKALEQNADNLSDWQKEELGKLGEGVEAQIRDAQEKADKMAETDPEAAAKFFAMRQKQIMEMADLRKKFLLSNDDQERARLAERMRLLGQADAREQELFERRRQQGSNTAAELAKRIQELLDRLTISDNTSEAGRQAIQRLNQLLVRLRQASGLAGGTDNWAGGWTWVGEEGPELLNLPRGAQVLPVPRLGSLAASGGAAGMQLVDVGVSLSLNSRGLDWLERFIDARVDDRTNRAASTADARRRNR